MTDEEWGEIIAKEKKARADAVGLLCQSLQVAGVPLYSLEIVERGASDCMVKATFEWGERWAKRCRTVIAPTSEKPWRNWKPIMRR